ACGRALPFGDTAGGQFDACDGDGDGDGPGGGDGGGPGPADEDQSCRAGRCQGPPDARSPARRAVSCELTYSDETVGGLDLPALAIIALHQCVDLLDTPAAHLLDVPVDLLAHARAIGQHAAQDELGEGTGHVEVRAGRFTALARGDEVALGAVL